MRSLVATWQHHKVSETPPTVKLFGGRVKRLDCVELFLFFAVGRALNLVVRLWTANSGGASEDRGAASFNFFFFKVMIAKVLRRIWLVYFFLVTIVVINILLFGALLLTFVGLLSDKSQRRLANWCTGSSWCFYPQCFEREAGGKVVVYGSLPPAKSERVLVLANHVEAPDWSIVFWLACAAGHLEHLKVFAKKSIRFGLLFV